RYGTRVNGVVFLSKLGVGQFDDNDVRLLEVLAGYASVALENAHLYESLRREAEHTKAWLEFSDAITSTESVDAIMGTTCATVARAPLPAGHGVKGWITVRAPAAGLDHFTEERLRLLDGLAYRASMAIQKAGLYREQQENAQVANALLEFGRVVGGTDDLEEI